MADPVTLGIATTVLSGVGLGIQGAQAVGAARQADQRRALHRRTGMAEAEALDRAGASARADANYIRNTLVGEVLGDTQERVGDFRSEGARVVGGQSLDYVRGGVRVSGSALRRLGQTRGSIDTGVSEIYQAGDRQVRQVRRQAGGLDRQAEDLAARADLTRLGATAGAPPSGATTFLQHLPGLAESGLNFASNLGNIPGAAPPRPAPPGGNVTNRAPLRPNYNTTRATLQI